MDADLAGAGGVQHPQVGQDGEAHRLAWEVVERHLLEAAVRRRGRRRGGRCRRRRDQAGRHQEQGGHESGSVHHQVVPRGGQYRRAAR
ncbi:hypothetical protein AB0F59_13735 [Micromonospora lupini]|uniref:hypothetical protein n=1 Tax=Micromonospora lupini TaxID=285679 RepID=UPI0033EDBD09